MQLLLLASAVSFTITESLQKDLTNNNCSIKGKSLAFSFFYHTNGDETTTATVDGAVGANVNGNIGFCLNYQQSV
jgi:hypothetical protein